MLGYKIVSEEEWNDLQKRLLDLERHFVTKRDDKGNVTQTLADVPVSQRKEAKKHPMAGMSWPQRRAWLEKTEGGRTLNG
jgi:hypothetical protein